MFTVDHPASIFDVAELGGATTRLHWAVLKEMHANGKTWSARAGGRLILLCGLYPIDGETAEAWFNAAPAAAPYIGRIVRRAKLTIGATGYREIVTVCRSEAGKRIARAAGFTFHATSGLGEVWTWKVSSEAAAAQPRSRRRRSKESPSPTSPNSKPISTRRRSAEAVVAGKPEAPC